MAAQTAPPRQGDHVFNDLSTAVLKPFLSIKALQSPFADGAQFLYSHLLLTYSIARQIADSPALIDARRLTATNVPEDIERALAPRGGSAFPPSSP